jgi:hypothetical protein
MSESGRAPFGPFLSIQVVDPPAIAAAASDAC